MERFTMNSKLAKECTFEIKQESFSSKPRTLEEIIDLYIQKARDGAYEHSAKMVEDAIKPQCGTSLQVVHAIRTAKEKDRKKSN